MVIHRNCQHTLGFVLTNDILIQTVLDFSRGQDVDVQIRRSRLDVCAVCACPARAGLGLIRLIGKQVVAQADAFAADIDTGANDHPLYFVLMLSAEAADQILFVFISAGVVICHNCFSLSWIDCFSGRLSDEQ